MRLPSTAISSVYLSLVGQENFHRALDCLSSATCRPCYPGRSHGPLPFSKSATSAFPVCQLGRQLQLRLTRLRVGSLALRFANWKLTPPCYQDAAPLNYRDVRTIPRTGLEPVRPNSCYCIRTAPYFHTMSKVIRGRGRKGWRKERANNRELSPLFSHPVRSLPPRLHSSIIR